MQNRAPVPFRPLLHSAHNLALPRAETRTQAARRAAVCLARKIARMVLKQKP